MGSTFYPIDTLDSAANVNAKMCELFCSIQTELKDVIKLFSIALNKF